MVTCAKWFCMYLSALEQCYALLSYKKWKQWIYKTTLFPHLTFLIHSYIFLSLSRFLSSSTSLRRCYFYPSLLSYSFSLTYKRTQQHKIVHYSVTVVVVFLFHFSLCMSCKEKMLLYALTPSTILKQKKYLQKEA